MVLYGRRESEFVEAEYLQIASDEDFESEDVTANSGQSTEYPSSDDVERDGEQCDVFPDGLRHRLRGRHHIVDVQSGEGLEMQMEIEFIKSHSFSAQDAQGALSQVRLIVVGIASSFIEWP